MKKKITFFFLITSLFIISVLFQGYRFYFLQDIGHLYSTKIADINKPIIFFSAIIYILPYIIIFIIFKYNKYFVSKKSEIKVNVKKFDKLIFIIIFFNLIFTKLYGLGNAVGGVYSAPMYAKILIIPLIRLDLTMGFNIYMCLKKKYDKYFIINFILYVYVYLIRGWSGFILPLILIFLFKRYKGRLTIKKSIFYFCLFFISIELYKYIDAYKYLIRTGSFYLKGDYFYYLKKFFVRISSFYDFYYLVNYYEFVKELIVKEFNFGVNLKESLVFVIPFKTNTINYVNIGNFLSCTVRGINDLSVGSKGGIIGVLLISFMISKVEFIFFFLLILSSIFIMLRKLKLLNNIVLNYYYYYILIWFIANGGTITYFKNVISILVYYYVCKWLKIIKLRRKNEKNIISQQRIIG